MTPSMDEDSHRVSAAGFHCNPKQSLPFAACPPLPSN